MPRTTSKVEMPQVTAKVSMKSLSYLRKRSEVTGTVAEAVREAVEAMHTFFGLPDLMANALREDARHLGKDEAGYIRELLAKRYEELLLERGKGSKK